MASRQSLAHSCCWLHWPTNVRSYPGWNLWQHGHHVLVNKLQKFTIYGGGGIKTTPNPVSKENTFKIQKNAYIFSLYVFINLIYLIIDENLTLIRYQATCIASANMKFFRQVAGYALFKITEIIFIYGLNLYYIYIKMY